MTGQTISHYTILEKLGEGEMGVVYQARAAAALIQADFAGVESIYSFSASRDGREMIIVGWRTMSTMVMIEELFSQ